MNKPLRRDKPQKKIRDWPTDRRREAPAYSGRNASGKRPQNDPPPSEPGKETQPRDEHFRWFPLSLVALVVLCLIMAAWVWFEILWM